MRKENNNYIIYKAVNTINNQVYIGATSSSLEHRKLDQIKKARNGLATKFYDSISTYGSSVFNWEQVDTASSIDELAQKEKHYILEYESKDNGYNSDEGGGFKKTVYQYNIIDGFLVNSYDCLTNAGNAVNATKQGISQACLSINHTYRGYYWSYEYSEPFEPYKDARRKEVLQYSLEGMLLSKYISVAEASRQTGLSKTCISRACRGEREKSGGYIWKYD